MAVSAGFSTRIYGEIEGSAPFAGPTGTTAFSRVIAYNPSGIQSLPSGSVNIVPLPNGYQMPNGAYVYSVIQLPPSGLNVHGTQLVTDSSVATLATSRG
jgi:hypothetical protein